MLFLEHQKAHPFDALFCFNHPRAAGFPHNPVNWPMSLRFENECGCFAVRNRAAKKNIELPDDHAEEADPIRLHSGT